MNFQKVAYENIKKNHFTTNILNFYHIKFYKKLSGELIFVLGTKNLKMFFFTSPTRQVLKK